MQILEDRVTERTAELLAANEHLKREIAERKTAERGLSRSADNQLHRFGISLVASLTTAENQPKDALLAALPIGTSPPHFESDPEPRAL